MPTPASFPSTFAAVADVEGWMSEGQARLLWDRASALGEGDLAVEIGSYHGRSAIVLATAAPPGAEVVAIDPHAGNDRGPQQIVGAVEDGQRDHETYVANLRRAGVADRVRHVRLPSQEAGGAVDHPIQLLYIDGAHRFAPARSDIVDWGARVADGGTLLIHDSFSSVGVTLAIASTLVAGSRFRYLGRSRSMAEYRREDLSPPARVVNALRQLAQLPWFARNLAVKALIVARLARLTRLLGHREPTWPY